MLQQVVTDILSAITGAKPASKAEKKALIDALVKAATPEAAPILLQQLLLAASCFAEEGKQSLARELLVFIESIAAKALKPIGAETVDHSKSRRAAKATGFVEAKRPVAAGGGGGSRRLFDLMITKE